MIGKKEKVFWSAAALVLVSAGLGIGSWLASQKYPACVTGVETRAVRGGSMRPLIEPGAKVKVELGYYSCREVVRGDLVLYDYQGNYDPLLKIAAGIPGDRFETVPDPTAPIYSNILVNGQVLKTSSGEPYVLEPRGTRLLSLYAEDYGSVIPPGTYLLMGDSPRGALDSTVFGLVSKNSLIGRALLGA